MKLTHESIEINAGLMIALVIVAILVVIFRWLWNSTLPDVFGVREVTFWQAFKIMLLASIPECAGSAGVLDYQTGTVACEGQRPFLTESMAPATPEEPHVIMYTSGTTGHPKGAVLSHRKTFFNCLNADIFFKLHFDDIMLIVLPLFHSGGLFIQASPVFYKGGTLVIHRKFSPPKIFKTIKEYQIEYPVGLYFVCQI